jgi:hypothetical protein
MKRAALGGILGWALVLGPTGLAADYSLGTGNPLYLPKVGDAGLLVLSPALLEITLVTTRPQVEPSAYYLDFENFGARLPGPERFRVVSGGQEVGVRGVGFRRRVGYAPLRERDLRIGNYLYLELSRGLAEGEEVEVVNPGGELWAGTVRLRGRMEWGRWSPVIHVNQVGYLPEEAKLALVGYYLGSLGEMPIRTEEGFRLVSEATGREVYWGSLVRRLDQGYDFGTYQQVWGADFSEYRQPGVYRVVVPGLGASWPFRIDAGVAAAWARTYALGLYHQRCGQENALPYTRFTHGPCHRALAEVPTLAYAQTQAVLAGMSSDYAADAGHTAPQLKDVGASLYPFVRRGLVEVSGGHHDAGDYSKYTINSAALIHYLVFAVDAFPGVGRLDNLGLPESGDGRSDLLQEAKWEADFLAQLQDSDGGFYFLVYPRDRPYELDVLPDRGDPQVVFPKTTAATAAAVAALAQIGSSPQFREEFPEAAAGYVRQARLGWEFLERAIERYGRGGAYQKISHYGDTFRHEDELAWAAAELYLATGEGRYHEALRGHFDPTDPQTRRWGWWGLFEGYGCAARSYAFGVRTGRVRAEQLSEAYLGQCRAALWAGARDQWSYAQANAYGTSFALEDKRFRNAAWYFPIDRAFDLAVGYQLDPRAELRAAILSNINYEHGANPLNLSYQAGLGWKRPREMVDQYAQNDRRVLPPTGKPTGSIQAGFGYLTHYREMLGLLSFPPDGDRSRPYPFYDRWGDSFNLSTEFVAVNQARSLATLAWLMAQGPLRDQPWTAAQGRIRLRPTAQPGSPALTARLEVVDADLDPDQAQIVWEATDQTPTFGGPFTFVPATLGAQWIEAEALWPDGRRIFASTNFTAADVLREGVVLVATFSSDGTTSPGFRLQAVAEPGRVLTLQSSTDLVTWVDLNSDQTGSLVYVDNRVEEQRTRFFRVLSAPGVSEASR